MNMGEGGCGCLFPLVIWGFIGLGFYESGGGWIFYTFGVIFVIIGLIILVQSSQTEQKAKKLERISKSISDGWK